MRQYNYIWGVDDLFRAQLTVDKENDEYTVRLVQHVLSEEALVNIEPLLPVVSQLTSSSVADDIIISVTHITIRTADNPRPETLFRLY